MTSSSADQAAAIETQGIPKGALAVLLGATFVSLFGVGIIVPVLPVYATKLGASGFLLGVMTASFSLASAIAQPYLSARSDERGRKPFIVVGLAVYGVAGFAYSLADSVWVLMGLRALQGVGAAMIFPIAMAYIGDRTPEREEGAYMGLYNVALFGGVGAGPIVGGFFKDTFGIGAAFYAMGAASFLAMLLVLLLLPEKRVAARDEEHMGMWLAFKTMVRSPRIQGIFSLRMAVQLVAIPTFVFLPLLMTVNMGATGTQVGIVITVRTLVNAVLQPLFGWVGDRHSKVAMAMAASVGLTVVVVLTGFATEFWQLVVLFTFLGLAESILWPTLSGLAVEEGRKFGMGYTLGVFTMVMNIGIFVGSMAAGLVVDMLGMTAMFIAVAGILAATTAGSGWLFRRPSLVREPALQSAPAALPRQAH